METAVYVWQRQWTGAVREAVSRAAREDVVLMVLAAEMTARGGLSHELASVDWAALADYGRPTWLVLRCDASLAARLADGGDTSAAELLGLLARDVVGPARRAGVAVAGVQLDYDCPTARLGDYGRLLDRLRGELPGTALAITALPTWLSSSRFAELVGRCEHYVLQVHSLEKPATMDDPVCLCDPAKVAGWVRRAGDFGKAFYASLPTYGYRVAFDERGRFAALSAEQAMPAYPAGYRVGVVMADPAEMARQVERLATSRPACCRGVAWFRLPVATDELCWPVEAFEAAMAGRPPAVSFAVECRSPQDSLYEIWLSNEGERDVLGPARFDVVIAARAVQAYDVLRGFTEERGDSAGRLRLVGPAPRVGETVMVAWFRLRPAEAGSPPATAPLVLTRVEVTP